MKERLNLTQEQLTFIGTRELLGFFSVLGGMYFDRFGSKATLFFGGTCKVIGFGMIDDDFKRDYFPTNHIFRVSPRISWGPGARRA